MTNAESIEDRLRRTFRAVAELPVAPAAVELQGMGPGRRGPVSLRRLAAVGAVAVAAAAVVLLVVYGPRSSQSGHSGVPATLPTASSTTSPSPSTTGPTLAQATAALDVYVAAEQVKESTAGMGSSANIWGAVISEHSAPVPQGYSFVAVTAYSFDPDGHPVQVLSYADGQWSQVAALSAPPEPGTVYHADSMYLFSENTPIAVATVSGDSSPAFLVEFAGGGCSSGAVVSQAGTAKTWSYVPFIGSAPISDVIGGDPTLQGDTIVSDNDCSAIPAPAAQRYTWTWTFDAASGDLRGVQHPGWPANPLGVGRGQ